MQRPPPIPVLNRHSMEYKSGGNLLNSITPCKEYYTHDSYGKSKYCIEVDLQGYPAESIRITRQLQDVTISLNHEEIKPTGEKYKQEFRREIQLPQSVDLNTLKSTILNKNTLLLYADVNKREQPILKSSQMSPNLKRHINWGLSCSPPLRNSILDSPKLRTSFSSEIRHRNSSFTNLPNDFNKSFHIKKQNLSNYQNIQRLSNHHQYRSNSFTKSEPINIPVRVETNQNHNQFTPMNNVQNIRVEITKNQPIHLKQFSKQSTLNHNQSQSQVPQNNHTTTTTTTHSNSNNYYYQNEHKLLNNNSTLKSQRPLHILPVTNNIDENDPINNISIQNNYNNAMNRLINHTTATTTTTTTNTTNNNINSTNHLTKPMKFYTQSMKVGLDVKPEDLNIHLKNGLLTIMIKQKGNNIENNQQTKIAREFLHENTIPINVDQNKLTAKLDRGILIWEAPYMTTSSTITTLTNDLIDIPG